MSSTNASVANELERIAALRDQGALTPEEFSAQKSRILGTSTVPRASDAPPVGAASKPVGDLWVYLILALPLTAAALIVYAWGNPSPPSVGEILSAIGRFFFKFPALVLILFDYWRLKAAGHRLPLWQMALALAPILLGLVLNPILGALSALIYLFFRARELNRGSAYVALYFAALLLVPALAAWPAAQN